MMHPTEAIAALRANLASLPEKDQDFANSLLTSASGRGLTEKQRYWVTKLAARATGQETAPPKVELNFDGVVALFRTAAQHLKFPKVRLQLEDGRPVCLAVAGPNSRKPGTVNVTDGGPYQNNVWYGRVDPVCGQWQPSDRADEATQTAVAALLTQLAADPAGVASRHGKLTGNCCFCDRTLTDERSTDVGYGPVCAAHFGLPWGGDFDPARADALLNGNVGVDPVRRRSRKPRHRPADSDYAGDGVDRRYEDQCAEQTGFSFGGWINR